MDIVFNYFPNLSDKQKEQFSQLQDLYQEWNSKINVISRKDIESLYERHVLHSLAIAAKYPFVPGTKIVDVGTGGGFPGIPLAIFFPQCNFTLIDSIGKKILVVKEISKSLKLKNVSAIQTRAEQLNKKFDFVVSRAVTAFPGFYNWTKRLIEKQGSNAFNNGIIYLKGGDFEHEINRFNVQINDISEMFNTPFFETKKIIYLPFS